MNLLTIKKANSLLISICTVILLACSGKTPQEIIVPPSFETPPTIEGFKRMLFIPEGQFVMGDHAGLAHEQPLRTIQMPAFYMDETPVKYTEFEKYVQEGGNRNAYWDYESYHQDEQPVSGISWYQAVDFCNWRSKREGLTVAYVKTTKLDAWNYPIWELREKATGYRLPTEAEFEYAARGGLIQKKFPWGDDFEDSLANYDTGKGIKVENWWRLAKVTEGKRNGYQLYNMSGNIWHWCQDWYGAYDSTDTLNPQGALEGRTKSLRGGSWGSINPDYIRVASRSFSAPNNYNYDIGFRCVRSIYADIPDTIKVLSDVTHQFSMPVQQLNDEVFVWDFSSQEFANTLAQFLEDNFINSVYFHTQVDQQVKTTPQQVVADILEVCETYKVNPLFLTSIMISESGFGTCSFPRWYNNPMAYHWQNRLMKVGLPSYKSYPNRRNRKYKTLKDAFRAFCKGIRRPWYYKAARKDLDAFHLVYVGYRADEWMNTLARVYRDVAHMQFEAKVPAKNAGKFIYTDWRG